MDQVSLRANPPPTRIDFVASRPQTTRSRRDSSLVTLAGPACTLRKALTYTNDDVVLAFVETYGISFQAAGAIFHETKKFLWLLVTCQSRGVNPPFITDHILAIDEMWHTFVLFSAEYRDYCFACYGRHVDHEPTTRAVKRQAEKDHRANPALVRRRWRSEFRRELSLIYDELGAATVRLWFTTYAARYSRERLEMLRHSQAMKRLQSQ